MEEKAARAYDLAALKYWGPSTHINFPVMILVHLTYSYIYKGLFQLFLLINVIMLLHQLENYQQELEDMKGMTRQEYVAHLRR